MNSKLRFAALLAFQVSPSVAKKLRFHADSLIRIPLFRVVSYGYSNESPQETTNMNDPFLPAAICFGPFFAILMFSAIVNKKAPERVPSSQIAVAVFISLGIGVAGAAASFLLI